MGNSTEAKKLQELRQVRKDMPVLIDSIVMKALEKAPIRRYQTARHMIEDMEEALASAPDLICPSCRTANTFGAKYCDICGAPLNYPILLDAPRPASVDKKIGKKTRKLKRGKTIKLE